MDFLKKFSSDLQTGHNTVATEAGTQNMTTDQAGKPQAGAGGVLNSLNNLMGGGAKGEQKEDAVDKAVDWVQEHVLHQGPQNNESAIEQQKDEAISDAIRDQYKKFTGKDFPIADKQ